MVPFIDTCADMVEHFGADFCTGGCRKVPVPEKTPAKGGVLPAAFESFEQGQRNTDCLINEMDNNKPGGQENGAAASAAPKKSSWWPQSKRRTMAKLFDCAKASKNMRRLCPCAVVEGAEGGSETGGGKVKYWYDTEGRASVEGA